MAEKDVSRDSPGHSGEGGETLRPAWGPVAVLLFLSGCCALLYQMVWLREFRLIFGASTQANAAVLAAFMGGLGLGSSVFGRWAEEHPHPLRFYAGLEMAIAGLAAVSPFLLSCCRMAYVATGGEASLGSGLATGLRLGMAALVIGVPALLMGGTLPAAARFVVPPQDLARRKVGWLYGLNTLGGCCGILLGTFWMLELIGLRRTIWMAAAVNLLVGLVAWTIARRFPPREEGTDLIGPPREDPVRPWGGPVALVLTATFLSGFSFFSLELVWNRILTPLLGGTVYTFGIVLAVALAGLGIGGALFTARKDSGRVSPGGLCTGFLVEAFLVGYPLWLGDQIALLAVTAGSLAQFGCCFQAMGWVGITALVVLPASIVAGWLFPALIAALGSGQRGVASQTGRAYLWNTAGAILGSILTGFVLLPLLTAPGCWRLAIALLLGVGFAFLPWVAAVGKADRWVARIALGGLTVWFLLSPGPSAFWRHSPIGAGRLSFHGCSPAQIRQEMHEAQRDIIWEADGVESSVGVNGVAGLGFMINGKSDSHASGDAETLVMTGLIPAILHESPRRIMMIGLGTGVSAGWLARIPSVTGIEVVELEPAVIEVASRCAVANFGVLADPKVRVTVGDARERVLTATDRWDLVLSEPSNPYRAGVSSLFTREFYVAVENRLAEGGIFGQWLQSYEIDALTFCSILHTLRSVFPQVEVWRMPPRDLVLVGRKTPVPAHSVGRLRQRVAEEPFRTALERVCQVPGLEGLLSRYVAGPGLADRVLDRFGQESPVVTDDRMFIEFGFARTLGREDALLTIEEIQAVGDGLGERRQAFTDGPVDWELVRKYEAVGRGRRERDDPRTSDPPGFDAQARALVAYSLGHLKLAASLWEAQSASPTHPFAMLAMGECWAERGDGRCLPLIGHLQERGWPEAFALEALFRLRQEGLAAAWPSLESFFSRARSDPWIYEPVLRRMLNRLKHLMDRSPEWAHRSGDLLAEPFVLFLCDEIRRFTRLEILKRFDERAAAGILESFEPEVPWAKEFLVTRMALYQRTSHPLAARAADEAREFFLQEGVSLKELLEAELPVSGQDVN